jgi:hypothetical protein
LNSTVKSIIIPLYNIKLMLLCWVISEPYIYIYIYILNCTLNEHYQCHVMSWYEIVWGKKKPNKDLGNIDVFKIWWLLGSYRYCLCVYFDKIFSAFILVCSGRTLLSLRENTGERGTPSAFFVTRPLLKKRQAKCSLNRSLVCVLIPWWFWRNFSYEIEGT